MIQVSHPVSAFPAPKRGPLSDDEIATGMHFSYCNARDLFEDAKILLNAGRNARALGLCVLCLEELAKIPLLCNAVMLRGKDASVWRRYWAGLSSHTLKQNLWYVYGRTFLPQTHRRKYYSRLYPVNMPPLERLKQMSFYMDFFEKGLEKGPIRPTVLFQDKNDFIEFVFEMSADRLKAWHPMHSTLERSRRVLQRTSRTKFTGLSDEELVTHVLEAMDSLKNYKHG